MLHNHRSYLGSITSEAPAWPQASSHPVLYCGFYVVREHDGRITRISELWVFILLVVLEAPTITYVSFVELPIYSALAVVLQKEPF